MPYGVFKGMEASQLPNVDSDKNYLVVSRPKEIDRMIYFGMSRFQWPYHEAYQAEISFKDEIIPGRLHMHRSPRILCPFIEHGVN